VVLLNWSDKKKMFTGIIERMHTLKSIKEEGTNMHFELETDIISELKVDQSIAHDGVCLTVTKIEEDSYWVTAVQETLEKTNLGSWQLGHQINIERSMQMGGRLDGHMVQGHVDTIATVQSLEEREGSWMYHFSFDSEDAHLLVSKGSICINGVSLTVVDVTDNSFSVTIIPYTYEHTGFKNFREGQKVNLEFDIVGKYIARYRELLK
jgi:riboflavin synthase